MRLLLAAAALAALTVVGCGGDDEDERIGVVHAAILPVDYPCADSFADVYGPSKGLPPFDDAQRGELTNCARDGTIDADTVAADQEADAMIAPELRDVDVYRIAYRTERLAQGAGQRDAKATAVVLVPHGARSDDVLVVWGHGSIGMGPQCDSAGAAPGDYESSQPLAIAAEGWITVVPDLAGFGDPAAMQGYLSAEDEAHSMLDATRAAAELFMRADSNPFKVVLAGVSQGGNSVLAAQALDPSYGHAGDIVAVAAFAPMWFPIRLLAGDELEGVYDPLEIPQLELSRTLWYFASRTELEGEPLADVFSPSGLTLERQVVQRQCHEVTETTIENDGLTPADFFRERFASVVSDCAQDDHCDGALAERWRGRMQDDRPHLDPSGPPVLMWQGALDTHVSPPRVECAIERLSADLAPRPDEPTAGLRFCVDPFAEHAQVLDRQLAWLDAYIGARVGLGPEPVDCDPVSTLSPGTAPYVCPFGDQD
jgi:hypothetical protein